jgi:AAA domain
MATQPQRHASIKDPSTWSDYGTALAAVQAGHADGISYVLTKADPFAAVDLDHCRDQSTHSIDIWAQNFLDVGRHSYSEVTPSGTGCRIWGLANGDSLQRKFTLEISGRQIAAELFRRTNKALTITGYKLNTIRELTNVDRLIEWAVVWGERRKAVASEQAAPAAATDFNGGHGSGYSVNQIEEIVRIGAPAGANRSDVFHTVVGHYVGCGWGVEQIFAHLQQHPEGIGGRYLAEDRLHGEIARSASKYNGGALPLFESAGWAGNGWDAKAPQQPEPELKEEPPQPQSEPDEADPEPDEDEDLEDLDEEPPEQDSDLPPLHAHGDPDPRPIKAWLIKHLIPEVGHGLLSGQWGTGTTFVVFDLVAALGTGQPFLGHTVKRQCGVLLIAAEGADEVRLRLDAVVREKCGGMARAPVRWYETAPMLLHKGAAEKLIAMARQAEASLQTEFGLPLGLIVIDTIAACAGYSQAGAENDNATGQAIMNVLKAVAQEIGCFVLGVDHFGKDLQAGTRGAYSKESSGDLVLACLGNKEPSGSVINTRLAVRKHRGGRQGQEYAFTLRMVEAPEKDEDGDPITTMVVDWLPAGSAAGDQAQPEPDPWIKGCRRDDQRAVMSRFKRVLLAALAEHGVEQPIPSKVGVKTSGVSIGDEVLTRSFDAPFVRMVDQHVVREAFDLCTPQDTRQTRHERFKAARDRAEQLGLLSAGNIGDITYLWLTRPEPKDDADG